MVSYAVSYEKVVSDRPFRCSVEPFALVPAHPKGPGKTSYPLLARCFRRHLLRTQKWLPLAAFAPRLPAMAYRLLSLQDNCALAERGASFTGPCVALRGTE